MINTFAKHNISRIFPIVGGNHSRGSFQKVGASDVMYAVPYEELILLRVLHAFNLLTVFIETIMGIYGDFQLLLFSCEM